MHRDKPALGHKVYPYLLRGLEINRINQVWATDITYIPMTRGFLYLVAIMDPDTIGTATCWPGPDGIGVQHSGGGLLR